MRPANVCITPILILANSLVQAWTSSTAGLSRSPGVKRDLNIFELRSTETDASNDLNASTEVIGSRYMNYGILISSFTDGIVSNERSSSSKTAQFFKYSLLSLLTMDKIKHSENDIEKSAKFSPCQGPDIESLDQLEKGDEIMAIKSNNNKNSEESHKTSREQKTNQMMHYLMDSVNHDVRVVYIPTASYALRSDSNNTPGKQRQRARADGKKRRDQVISFIEEMFAEEETHDGTRKKAKDLKLLVSVVTLDLDDNSIKQAAGPHGNNSELPKDGIEALTDWKPHLIYIEGGNTFWLHHCMNKGDIDWSSLISDACCVANESERRPALYVGKSAGAIAAGKYVETATWKGKKKVDRDFITYILSPTYNTCRNLYIYYINSRLG